MSKKSEIKEKIEKLNKELSITKNENAKLDIIYQLRVLRDELDKLPNEEEKKVTEAKKEEPKVEEKKVTEEPIINDMNRGKVAEPGSSIPDHHKKDDNKNNKKN